MVVGVEVEVEEVVEEEEVHGVVQEVVAEHLVQEAMLALQGGAAAQEDLDLV